MQHERCFELSPAEAQVHALRLFFHLLPAPTTSLHLPRSPSTSRHLPPPPSISLDLPPHLSTSLNLRQVHALVRLFLDEAAGAPASGGARQPQRVEAARRREAQGVGGSAIPAPRLPPLAEGGEGAEGGGEHEEAEEAEEAREAEKAHRMQLQAPQGALALAVQAGAAEAAAVWRCTPCGCNAVFCEPCPGCGASQPAGAMQAAIAAVRPLLDAAPGGSGAANDAFYRGALDGYAVGMSGVFQEHPATFRLVEPGQLPALPAPLSNTVREMRLRLGA